MSGGDLPPGIRRRHARSCPAAATDDLAACRCRPAYQAQAGPRRDRRTRTHKTLAAARSWKRDVDRAFERGELAGEKAPRVRDAADAWLSKAEKGIALARGDQPYRPSTVRLYRRLLESELYDVLGDRRLDQITRERLNEYVQGLQARGLAAQTVKNVLIPLRAIYRDAIDLGKVRANPTTGVRVPAGSGRRLTFLAPGEIIPLLDALEGGDRALWATAVYTGLRRGELMALRWSDVDLAAGSVTVRLSYDAVAGTMGPVKTVAGQDRRVPIIAALRDHLTEHRQRARRATGLVFPRGSLAGRCTPATRDLPFTDRVSLRAARRWAEVGVRPVTLHACRHTFASLMIAAMADGGAFDPKAIQQMLGHASITQTYDRYGHLFPGAEDAAARMLDSFLGGQEGDQHVMAAVSRLREALDDAAPRLALPAVLEAHGMVRSWLADHEALPLVTDELERRRDRQAAVPRTPDLGDVLGSDHVDRRRVDGLLGAPGRESPSFSAQGDRMERVRRRQPP